MRKVILFLLILALIISLSGCAGKNDKETGAQQASDTHELRSNETQDANIIQTGEGGNLNAEWKYIDPSLVYVHDEEEEKTIAEI